MSEASVAGSMHFLSSVAGPSPNNAQQKGGAKFKLN
jgi:hypothetical protein